MSLENYIKGERYGEKAYELEREAMRDSFLQDAIDGYDLEDDYSTPHLKKLKKQIKKRTGKNYRNLQLWSIVACVLIIIGFSIFFFLYDSSNKDEENTAFVNIHPTEPVANTARVPNNSDNHDITQEIDANNQPADLLPGKERTPVQQDNRINSDEIQRIVRNQMRDEGSTYSGNERNTYTLSNSEIQEILTTYVQRDTKAPNVADQTPKPVAGNQAYNDYISNNRRTLAGDVYEKQHGKVILLFKVNEDGRPSDISILRSLNQAADREAVRLLQNGPNWTASNKNTYLEIDF